MESLCETFPSTVSSRPRPFRNESRVESRRKNPEQSSSESIVKRNFLFCHQLSFKSYTIRRQFKHFLFNAHSPPSSPLNIKRKNIIWWVIDSILAEKKLNWVFVHLMNIIRSHSSVFDNARLRDIWFNGKMISLQRRKRRRRRKLVRWGMKDLRVNGMKRNHPRGDIKAYNNI